METILEVLSLPLFAFITEVNDFSFSKDWL